MMLSSLAFTFMARFVSSGSRTHSYTSVLFGCRDKEQGTREKGVGCLLEAGDGKMNREMTFCTCVVYEMWRIFCLV